MPRQRRDQFVKWNLTIPAELAAIVETHFWSQSHAKPAYGARNALVVELLWTWANTHGMQLPPRETTPQPHGVPENV